MFWHFSHKKSSTISLFPRAALTPTSYHLAGIDSPPKESISEPICFHCQMLSGPPHRKAPFPECGSGIKRHLPLTLSPPPRGLLPRSQLLGGGDRLSPRRTGRPDGPLRKHHCVQSGSI